MPSNGMPLAAVELEDPAGDVVEEIAVVGDGDRRCPCSRRGSARARRPTRRRGGSSARRAAAGRATRAAGGTERRAAARRRRASSRRGRRPGAAARPSRGRASRRATRRRGGRSAPGQRACSASSVSKSASGSAKAAEIALKRSSRSRSGAYAVLDVTAHVLGRVELRLLLEEADARAGREVCDAARRLLAARP